MAQTFEQRIKVLSAFYKVSLGEISNIFGITQGAFLSRCRVGKVSFGDQKKIADFLGCKVVNRFVFFDGRIFEESTATELIEEVLKYTGTTKAFLGECMGKSRPAMSIRIKGGHFTYEELSKIADIVGCAYEGYFELPNGMRV